MKMPITLTGSNLADLVNDQNVRDINDELFNLHHFQRVNDTWIVKNLIILGEVNFKRFADNVAFSDCQFESITIRSNLGDYSVEFGEKTSITTLELTSNSTVYSIGFTGDSAVNELIVNANCKLESLSINEDAVIGNIDINEKAEISHLNISNNSRIGPIYISSSASVNELWVGGKSNIEIIDFMGNSSCSKLVFEFNSRVGALRLQDNCKLDMIAIYDKVEIDEIQFEGGSIQKSFKINNLQTPQLTLCGNKTHFGTPLLIEGLKINILHIYNFSTNNSLRLSQIDLLYRENKSRVNFIKSFFQKLELVENQFDKFQEFKFENSDFTNAFISSTEFPETILSEKKRRT